MSDSCPRCASHPQDKDPETILKFSTDCANAVVPAYVPLVEKHKNDPYNTRQKEWQQMRRGRYVECACPDWIGGAL